MKMKRDHSYVLFVMFTRNFLCQVSGVWYRESWRRHATDLLAREDE